MEKTRTFRWDWHNSAGVIDSVSITVTEGPAADYVAAPREVRDWLMYMCAGDKITLTEE